ncbi:hypothetical protein [Bacillus albus]|uniref:hypothetical protein n=1 Tax=Bacillus albus TaxID=2026189 RepID=UPI001F5D55A8|nr:hypothetical protein [Bacillus albus]
MLRMFLSFVSPLFLGVSAGWGVGASPLNLNVTKYGVRILLRTIELVVRLVQLLIQVEQLNLVFGLFGLAKAKNQPNFGMQWKKRWRFFEWVSQKILPAHCVEKNPLYRE